jgi:catalase
MLQGRLFAYGDAHRYRLGVNHTRIPVNSAKGVAGGASNYGRDGAMRFDANGDRVKNYEPNSFGGPAQSDEPLYEGLAVSGVSSATAAEGRAEDDDFSQAGALYRLMADDERARLVARIAGSLGQVSRQEIIDRALAHFVRADAEYGARLEAAVKEIRAS